MESTKEHRSSTAAFLLVIPGATIVGLGVGLMFRQAGFGLITGIGGGLLLWGLIAAFRK